MKGVEEIITKLQTRLKELEAQRTWDDWEEGVNWGRKDMIEEVILMLQKDDKNS